MALVRTLKMVRETRTIYLVAIAGVSKNGDSARTDEDEAFKEQYDIEDPFQTDTARSI